MELSGECLPDMSAILSSSPKTAETMKQRLLLCAIPACSGLWKRFTKRKWLRTAPSVEEGGASCSFVTFLWDPHRQRPCCSCDYPLCQAINFQVTTVKTQDPGSLLRVLLRQTLFWNFLFLLPFFFFFCGAEMRQCLIV